MLWVAVRFSTVLLHPYGRAYSPLAFQINVRSSRLKRFSESMKRACYTAISTRVVFSPSIFPCNFYGPPPQHLFQSWKILSSHSYAHTVWEVERSWEFEFLLCHNLSYYSVPSSYPGERGYSALSHFPETFSMRIALKVFQWNIWVKGICEISGCQRFPWFESSVCAWNLGLQGGVIDFLIVVRLSCVLLHSLFYRH